MTTNMLSIVNILAGIKGAGTPNAASLAIQKRDQSFSTLIEGKPLTKTRRDGKIGNIQVKHKNRLIDKPTGEFGHTFRKEITSEVPQKAPQNGRNVLKQNQIPVAVGQPSVILPLIAQWSLKAGHGPDGIIKKVELQSGLEHAQLYNNLSKDMSHLGVGTTTEPQNSEPIPIVNSKQIGLKEIPSKTSQSPFSIEIPSNKVENANRIQIPEGKPLAAKGVFNEQDSEGLALQPLVRSHRGITTANEKSEYVPISEAFDSRQTPILAVEEPKQQAFVDAHNGIATIGEKATIASTFNASGSQQTLPLVVEELTPEAVVGTDGEITNVIQKPAVADKPVVPNSQKAPEQNPNLPLVQDKPSGLQPQSVGIVLGKSPLIAEQGVDHGTNPAQQGQVLSESSTGDKATAIQPRRPGTPRLSEPLADGITEQGPKSSNQPACQHLHKVQFQVSAVPVRGRGDSASGNNNADSDFGQILFGNNTATYIEEPISIFPEAVKTGDLPVKDLPNNVSASITQQILESIQSSSSQEVGIRQITIRLHPPELGRVFIKFEEQESQIIGLVEVNKTQTRYEVEQALPQIIQNLADCGIQIKRLEVVLTDQNEQHSYGHESLQDGLFQQHHDLPEWDNPDNPGTLSDNDLGIVVNSSSYKDGFEPQVQITDNSINILI